MLTSAKYTNNIIKKINFVIDSFNNMEVSEKEKIFNKLKGSLVKYDNKLFNAIIYTIRKKDKKRDNRFVDYRHFK